MADLTDTELNELDRLLAVDAPAALAPLDLLSLDGFLCGLLVQPLIVPPEQWLPFVFDAEGRPLDAATVDASWQGRCTTLILKRFGALNAAISEDGFFDPLIAETAVGDGEPPAPDDPRIAELPVVSRALLPWVSGFAQAMSVVPHLEELGDEAVDFALARIYRHLPAENDDRREQVELLDRELPIATVDDAVDDLVAAVVELWELTADERFQVDTVRREQAKVGRNDPCPCGSGKKFKKCHGAAA